MDYNQNSAYESQFKSLERVLFLSYDDTLTNIEWEWEVLHLHTVYSCQW